MGSKWCRTVGQQLPTSPEGDCPPTSTVLPPSFPTSVAISDPDQCVSGNVKYSYHMITSNQGRPRDFPQAEHIMLWLLFTPKFGKLWQDGVDIYSTFLWAPKKCSFRGEIQQLYTREKRSPQGSALAHRSTDFIPKLQWVFVKEKYTLTASELLNPNWWQFQDQWFEVLFPNPSSC